MERRFSPQGLVGVSLQKRAEGEFPTVVGYGAVFYNGSADSEYDLFGDGTFLERILPGAFDRAIREGDDVRALFNHDPDHLLGRTKSGTLKLSVDPRGLFYEIDPPETQLGKQVTVAIERGDLSGSSFAFQIEEQQFRETGNILIREIVSVRLFDVGPVTYPAYEGTTTGLRSVDVENVRKEYDELRRRLRGDADYVDVRSRLVNLALTESDA